MLQIACSNHAHLRVSLRIQTPSTSLVAALYSRLRHSFVRMRSRRVAAAVWLAGLCLSGGAAHAPSITRADEWAPYVRDKISFDCERIRDVRCDISFFYRSKKMKSVETKAASGGKSPTRPHADALLGTHAFFRPPRKRRSRAPESTSAARLSLSTTRGAHRRARYLLYELRD